MAEKKELTTPGQKGGDASSPATVDSTDAMPKPLTLAENVVLTIKLLVGAGVLLLVFWLINRGN